MQRQIKFRAWTGEKMRPCAVSVDGKAMIGNKNYIGDIYSNPELLNKSTF